MESPWQNSLKKLIFINHTLVSFIEWTENSVEAQKWKSVESGMSPAGVTHPLIYLHQVYICPINHYRRPLQAYRSKRKEGDVIC